MIGNVYILRNRMDGLVPDDIVEVYMDGIGSRVACLILKSRSKVGHTAHPSPDARVNLYRKKMRCYYVSKFLLTSDNKISKRELISMLGSDE